MRKVKPKVDDYSSGPMLKPTKSKPRYPTVRMDLDTIPEAKEWKVGKTYEVGLKLKMVGISQSRFDNSAEFEIRGIEPDDTEVEDEADKSSEEKP